MDKKQEKNAQPTMTIEELDELLLNKGGQVEKNIRAWFVARYCQDPTNIKFPTCKVDDLHKLFKADTDGAKGSYAAVNAVVNNKIRAELVEAGLIKGTGLSINLTNPVATGIEVPENVEIDITNDIVLVKDLEFPNFYRYKTGTELDEICSDHEVGGGIYGGTVYICIGESGVGKTTVLLDALANIQENEKKNKVIYGQDLDRWFNGPIAKYLKEKEECGNDKTKLKALVKPEKPQHRPLKILYISSEMTRNDILFAYKKQPAIGEVSTLLLMDYIKGGMDQALQQAFNKKYDMIVLDSYQDSIVKMIDVLGWKPRAASTFLINLMLDAAEKDGTAVFAIQHMTKGGQYVGGTFLKHATTGMLEIRFDGDERYIQFLKNRRGGSKVYKRMYYTLDTETGKLIYDKERFQREENIAMTKEENSEIIKELEKEFEETFLRNPIEDIEKEATSEIDTNDIKVEDKENKLT